MSETYIVTAKTVEEAVSIANSKYADENHEVSYEIVEMPKKGFLGIGSKEAKIKVTVTETKPVELGSLVADIRSMKNLTDRGGEEKKSQPQQKQQKNQNNQQGKNQQNNKNQNNQQGKNQQQNNKNNNQQKQNNKPAQQKPENKQENTPAAPASEEKAQNKTRLNNQALPGKRNKQRKSGPADADISASAVTVNAPANLSEFVSEKTAENAFGSSQRASGGRMNNDVRRGKKPAQGKPVSTDTRDRQMLDSKYDVAETDDDYKNLDKLERDSENLLEREALTALGLGEKEEAAVEAAPETRTREAVTEDEMKYALEFANTLLKNMQIGAEAVPMECPENEELIVTEKATVYPKINIVGDDSGILIGHHGETLDSIQYLVNLCALRKTKSKDGDYVKIVVDIENYREKREDTLRALARRMAAKAVKYKRNVFLEPMNAYERRIIHSELQKYPGVSTHSVGSDRDRKIIITYEGADKAPENRNRRRRGNKGGKQNKSQDSKSAEKNQSPVNGNENGESAAANAGEKKPHRRPRKVQKLTIDKLGDLLDGNETVKLEPADEE